MEIGYLCNPSQQNLQYANLVVPFSNLIIIKYKKVPTTGHATCQYFRVMDWWRTQALIYYRGLVLYLCNPLQQNLQYANLVVPISNLIIIKYEMVPTTGHATCQYFRVMEWRTQALIYYRGLVWHRWHERDKGTCVHILTPHILPIAFTVLSHVHLAHYSHMNTHACIQCKKLTKKPGWILFFLNNLAKRRGSSKRHKRRPFPSHSNVNNSSHRQRTTLNILTTQLTKQTVPYVLVSLSSKSLSEPETLSKG